MIIDTHIHIYDPSRPEGVPWPPSDNKLLYRTVLPEHAKAQAVPEGVTGTVIVEATDWLEDNQWVLDLAADEPFIVGLVGRIDPCTDNFAESVARFAEHPLFQGIRFRGKRHFDDIDRGSFMKDMETLAKHNLVLDVGLGQEDANGLFMLLERLPELRVMIEHIAGVTVDGNMPDNKWIEHMHQAAAHLQVWMKVSALMENSTVQPASGDVAFYTPTLDALWDIFGEDRLVYGSNWPVCERAGTYAQCMDIVRTYFAGKSEDAREKFFWKNSQMVYRWVDRQIGK
jgi:L-fuconolactonase